MIGHVLLIDDEKIDQMLHRRVIDRSGLVKNVTAFQFADHALEHLRAPERAPVDVIFLDINMPRMNGFEFLEAAGAELGTTFADAVVIMLTTPLDPRDRDRATACPLVRSFVDKPLTVDHLRMVDHLLVDRRAA